MPLYKKVQSALDKVLGITRENLSGARVIRAFGTEDAEVEKFTASNDSLTQAQTFVGKISALLNPATYVILHVAIIVLIWTGALQVEQGILTQGMVVALYNYMSQILVELIKLANLIITITKSIACAKRVGEVLDIEPSIKGAESLPEAVDTPFAVEFSGASLRYNKTTVSNLILFVFFQPPRFQIFLPRSTEWRIGYTEVKFHSWMSIVTDG